MSYQNMMFTRWSDGNKEILFARPGGCNIWDYEKHATPRGSGGNGGLGVSQSLVDAFFMKTACRRTLRVRATVKRDIPRLPTFVILHGLRAARQRHQERLRFLEHTTCTVAERRDFMSQCSTTGRGIGSLKDSLNFIIRQWTAVDTIRLKQDMN